ncbi:MAG: hypothetical protein CL862_08225 [Cyanobium sp. NAT70]|nr:hypothetical protein [Cyanobium sp. NAT70]|tara:strand:- start:1346 stop:1543 length:198 start_codon:yes stop_codon:yes gene_type:complete
MKSALQKPENRLDYFSLFKEKIILHISIQPSDLHPSPIDRKVCVTITGPETVQQNSAERENNRKP